MPLPASPISIAQDSPWISHLSDLQCNIIKYHGRKHAWHIFFEIQHNKELQAQLWLTRLKIELKTALEQIQEGVKYRQALADGHPFDGGIIETISFSCTGIRRLNICSDITFESAFCEGMKKRQVQLLDDVSKFEDAFKQPLDGLLMIADNDKRSGKKRLRQRLLELAAFAHIHAVQKGKQEKRGKIAVEHFGYADGISQPLFLDTEIDAQHSTLHWNDKADAKELLLVTTQDNEQVAGSYLVFRKLEQNVMAFNEAVKRLTVGNNADKHLCPVLNAGGYYNPDLPAAMAVGRFKDGTPVVQHSEIVERQSNKEMDNDFNYEGDPGGLRCPRFGHVRLTNPRRDDDKQHRIARRGIPYNDTGLRRHFEKKDENLSLYTHNLGLLFMCYQKSIEKQFETVQGNWANLGSVKGLSQVGKDPIIGQQKPQGVMVDAENKLPKYLPKQWGQVMLHDAPINFDGFVTTKGGEYFFTPALHLLSNSP